MSSDPTAAYQAALSRRAFLQSLGAAGVLLGSGAALAACGRSPDKSQKNTKASKPRRGGTLRVGMIGSGKSESFNPSGASATLINMARTCAVFDSLVTVSADLQIKPALATKWTPNADASAWTFTLRPGVTWHDGKPLTTADVLYSLRWTADSSLASAVANVDLKNLRAPNANTIVMPLKAPDLLFPENLSAMWIIQAGTKSFVHPIGTGAFVFGSLNQGEQSVCTRNPHYWDAPRPYVDKLIIRSIDDDSARLNALLGGQIDVLCNLPFAQAKAQQSSSNITLLNTPSAAAQAFYMAVDQKPFDDVRVRQAIKLLADRQQLVDVALDGFGQVANDMFGMGLPFYDSSLPQRKRDVAKAKSLLAAAGHASGLSLTLETSPVSPGVVEAATLFAQQAKAGGVDIKISQVDAGAYFDPTLRYLKMPFAQTLWSGFDSLSSFYQYALVPGGSGNETHWTNKQTATTIAAAASAADKATAAAAWNKVQQEQYDDGGYLWWANVNNVDATSNKVAGIKASKFLAMGLPTSLADAYFVS